MGHYDPIRFPGIEFYPLSTNPIQSQDLIETRPSEVRSCEIQSVFILFMCVFSLSLSLSLSVCLSRSNPAVSFRLVFHPIQSPRPPRLQLDPVVFHSDVILRHPIRNSRILSNPIRSDSV